MDDEKPQPFTLIWWLLMHRYAAWTNERSFQNHFERTEDRFEKLTHWIERRIVREYGMRDYGAVMAPLSIIGDIKPGWVTVTTPNTKPVWLCIQCGQMDPKACARPSCPWLSATLK